MSKNRQEISSFHMFTIIIFLLINKNAFSGMIYKLYHPNEFLFSSFNKHFEINFNHSQLQSFQHGIVLFILYIKVSFVSFFFIDLAAIFLKKPIETARIRPEYQKEVSIYSFSHSEVDVFVLSSF